MQAQRIDTEVDKDWVPKAQFKEIDAEAHPGPNARNNFSQGSWLPKNAVNRTPKLQSGATVTTRGGCSLIAEEALNQRERQPRTPFWRPRLPPRRPHALIAAERPGDLLVCTECGRRARTIAASKRLRGEECPGHPLWRMVADATGQKAGDLGSKGHALWESGPLGW